MVGGGSLNPAYSPKKCPGGASVVNRCHGVGNTDTERTRTNDAATMGETCAIHAEKELKLTNQPHQITNTERN